MFTLGILSLLRRSHQIVRGVLGALWIGLLIFQSLNSSTGSCSHEMQSTATVSSAANSGMAMHTATSMSDWSVTGANATMLADASSMPLPVQSLPCQHAAMTGACQACVNVATIVIATVSILAATADGPFLLPHTARSQLIIAPDAPPPKA